MSYDIESKLLVSIIVPIYNVQDYLGECIESILGQTYERLEVILVNDGSTDNCADICEKYKDLDSRIKIIHKKNGGLSEARNVGLENSTGNYVCFIDSDDYIDSHYVEELLNLLIFNECDISICSYNKVSDNRCVECGVDNIPVGTFRGEEVVDCLYTANHIYTIVAWNKLYKKSLFEGIRYPVGLIYEDEATTCQLLLGAKKVALSDRELYFYRIRKASITNSGITVEKLQSKLDALTIRRNYFKDNNLLYFYSKDCLVYLQEVSKNCFKISTMFNDYKMVMIKEYRKMYVISDKRAWKLRSKVIMFVTWFIPSLYGWIKSKMAK